MHECKLPGNFMQWLHGISVGSIWQCARCDTVWVLVEDYRDNRKWILYRP